MPVAGDLGNLGRLEGLGCFVGAALSSQRPALSPVGPSSGRSRFRGAAAGSIRPSSRVAASTTGTLIFVGMVVPVRRSLRSVVGRRHQCQLLVQRIQVRREDFA